MPGGDADLQAIRDVPSLPGVMLAEAESAAHVDWAVTGLLGQPVDPASRSRMTASAGQVVAAAKASGRAPDTSNHERARSRVSRWRRAGSSASSLVSGQGVLESVAAVALAASAGSDMVTVVVSTTHQVCEGVEEPREHVLSEFVGVVEDSCHRWLSSRLGVRCGRR